MDRLKVLSYEEMGEDQQNLHDAILAGPRSNIGGPMNAWFRSPPLGHIAQKLGAFCRFETGLEPRLSELVILVVARHWTAQVEWGAHKPLALKAGLDPAVVDAIKARRRPDFAKEDEEAVYDLCMELQETRRLGDAAYDQALEIFGERKLVEMIAILGYYTSVAMILNGFLVESPKSAERFDD